MVTWSLMNVLASISGPGYTVDLMGCVTTDGIQITPNDERNLMTPGGNGCVMHTLRLNKSGRILVNLLTTSATNAELYEMMNYQMSDPTLHGQNVISIKHGTLGDDITAKFVAFVGPPEVTWTADGSARQWAFDAGEIQYTGSTVTGQILTENYV